MRCPNRIPVETPRPPSIPVAWASCAETHAVCPSGGQATAAELFGAGRRHAGPSRLSLAGNGCCGWGITRHPQRRLVDRREHQARLRAVDRRRSQLRGGPDDCRGGRVGDRSPMLAAGSDGLVCAIFGVFPKQILRGGKKERRPEIIAPIMVACSTDHGPTFSAPIELGQGAMEMRVPGGASGLGLPMIAVDRRDGVLICDLRQPPSGRAVLAGHRLGVAGPRTHVEHAPPSHAGAARCLLLLALPRHR